MDFTFQKLQAAAEEARAECRLAEDQLEKAVYAAANADREFRLARALAFKTAREAAGRSLTIPEKEALVDEQTAGARKLRDETDGLKMLATEKCRNRRQELSLLQSLAAAWRAEAELGKYSGESAA